MDSTPSSAPAIQDSSKNTFPDVSKLKLLWAVHHSSLRTKLNFNILREICAYYGKIDFIPWIHRTSLKVYDLTRNTIIQATLAHNFTYGSVHCVVGDHIVICLGGAPPDDQVFKLNVMDSQLVQVESLHTARSYPGAITHDTFVYVFGGYDRQRSLISCEKFDICKKSWTNLANMHSPKRNFSPCLYEGKIYLLDAPVLETFNILTEQFVLSRVFAPSIDMRDSISFVIGAELVIVSDNHICTWRMDTGERCFKVVVSDIGKGKAFCSCPPLVIARKAYWVPFGKAVFVFDLDTYSIASQ